jgi:undecaprenyl-diphosphatase
MAVEPESPEGATDDRRGLAVAGLAIAAVIAASLTVAIVSIDGRPTGADSAVYDFTRDWTASVPIAVDIARFIGAVTGPLLSTVYGIVIAAILWLAARRPAAGFLAVSAIVGVIAVEGMKLAVGRQRPPGAEQFLSDLEKSFPSGHSAAGMYLYLALGVILVHVAALDGIGWVRYLGLALIVISPVIGLSRIVLGVHWATDVVAGWAYGSTAVLLAALLFWDPMRALWRAPAAAD